MYEALSKLFTIKNLGQITSLKNELRTINMTKKDDLSSIFVRIARIKDELQEINEIVPEKDLVITTLLGLPTSWGAFPLGLKGWKENTTFKQLWNARSQEEVKISLLSHRENEEEKISNAYSTHHKNKGTFNKSKGPRRKVDLSNIQCHNCHRMGDYRRNCLENLRNRKRNMY